LDDDDLPLINDKEAIAIADYIAYTVKYKEALRTNNSTVFQMAQTIKAQWRIHCDAARVPEYINQNEMDDLLEVMSSHNRKVHGRSYKPTV
jgi:precorrin isomerase